MTGRGQIEDSAGMNRRGRPDVIIEDSGQLEGDEFRIEALPRPVRHDSDGESVVMEESLCSSPTPLESGRAMPRSTPRVQAQRESSLRTVCQGDRPPEAFEQLTAQQVDRKSG